MADTLGLHVDPAGITAVRLDAVAGTGPTVIALGTDGPVATTLVARDEGGAVLVGDAARTASGPTVDDPLGRAAAGQIGALVAVINHVVGRSALATGRAPVRLAVVVPDDFDAAARDRIVEAGAAAGVADTVAVPHSVAETRVGSDDPAVAIAAGAARVASLAAAPIVTREDLGGNLGEGPPAVPPEPPSGSVSVFDHGDDEDGPEPARPAPTPVTAGPAAPPPAAAPPTRVLPITPAPPAETLRYEPPARRMSAAVVAVVVLVALIAAVGVGLVVFRPDDDPTVTDDTSTTLAPTTEAPTTTAATTTTPDVSTSSTTSSPSTSSSTTSTTSSTTTEPPSTTTTPVPVATPGAVTLVETGLKLEDGVVVLFGQSVDSVLEAMSAVLGDPDTDSGYEEISFCLGARTRFVTWGDLELVFTEEEAGTEDGRFTQWYASGHDDPEGLVTFSGIGVGATVGFLDVTLGSSLQLVEVFPDDPTGLFAATNPGSGAVLNGTTSSRDPEGTVTSLWAGDSCTRIFT